MTWYGRKSGFRHGNRCLGIIKYGNRCLCVLAHPDQYIRTLHLSLSCTIIDSKLYLHVAAVVYSICMDLETVVVFV